jgi:branched-chain amino acid aminotransferase
MIVWIDGALMPVEAARIDPRDRGFTLGDGLYETIRVRSGEIVRIDRHFARLAEGLRVLDLPLVLDEAGWTDGMEAVLRENGLTDAALRLTVSRGVAARGMGPDPHARPTMVIAATPFAALPPARVIVARSTRRNEHSPLSRIKTTSCLDSIVARIEAARSGADDAVLLNSRGRVAEASAANLFAVIGGRLVTPPIADGALPGVMRGAILEATEAEERSLTVADLNTADELLLTSSLGVRSVLSLDGRPLACGPAIARMREFV